MVEVVQGLVQAVQGVGHQSKYNVFKTRQWSKYTVLESGQRSIHSPVGGARMESLNLGGRADTLSSNNSRFWALRTELSGLNSGAGCCRSLQGMVQVVQGVAQAVQGAR